MAKKVGFAAVLLLVALAILIEWRMAERRAEAKQLRQLDITVVRDTVAPYSLQRFVDISTLGALFPKGEIIGVRLGPRATDESVAVAARIKRASQLVFETTNITPAGYAQLANATTGWDESGNVTGFLTLCFYNTGATDETFASLPPIRGIEVISLTEPAITDAGIVQLKRLPDLKALDATRTAITADGAARLKAALPTCEIGLPSPLWTTRAP